MATALYKNPFLKHSHNVQRVLAMFWSRDQDAVKTLFELTRHIRCRDPWLKRDVCSSHAQAKGD